MSSLSARGAVIMALVSPAEVTAHYISTATSDAILALITA